jgi:hypothetical protein|tara:strand:+ start:7565 stop:7780 length:216 start_codon:yes stop_codon:yes gene_type:complete
MTKFLEMLKRMGMKFAVGQIRSKKDQILSGINKKLDIPLLSEKDERDLLEGVWALIDDVLLEIQNDTEVSD